MRDLNDLMICEICIVGLDFMYEEFKSKRMLISLYAGTMFMFHDERDGVKQVMMGHLDAMSEVAIDNGFYK